MAPPSPSSGCVIWRSSFPENVLKESYLLSRLMALPSDRAAGGWPPGIGCDRNTALPFCCCGSRSSVVVPCSVALASMACLRRSCEPPAMGTGCGGGPKPLGEAGRLMEWGCMERYPGAWSGGSTASLRRAPGFGLSGGSSALGAAAASLGLGVTTSKQARLATSTSARSDGTPRPLLLSRSIDRCSQYFLPENEAADRRPFKANKEHYDL
jgi:hypothetical protein